ncbi:quinone oxidoreductase family protein [Acetobacter persici]|uniref:quinone oxidoreductase family protein n=1 Tax=Acetobacter persici TaxID=1076596 RepID=UPI001BAA8E2F|nr:zinc-binding alcohol dehydrogenase family protein [Acetobacter persici]MBS1015591.1 zinc-binding alcohol dehydrogenase family protein [Acetobacter persici]
MKALVATRFGTAPQMSLEDRPKPVGKPGYSVVKMYAATVNPLSAQIRQGVLDIAHPPLVLSNDGSGTVEESAVFPAGTRVAIYGGGELGITQDGLQQQWVCVENKRLFVLPDTLSLEEGAALSINFITAYQALTRVGRVKAGQTVLISGASGSVGHALSQLAFSLGAVPIAIVSHASKIEAAQKSGVKTALVFSEHTFQDAVLDATDGQGADLAFDPVGGSLLPHLMAALRPRGAVVSIGFVGGIESTLTLTDVIIHEKRLLGYDAWLETDEAVAQAFDALRGFIVNGQVRPVIDSIWPLNDFEAAYDRLASRRATGSILLRC